MGKLINLISQNSALKFIDAETENTFTLAEILNNKTFEKLKVPRSLTFLYLDNSFASVSTLLNFLYSEHAIILLNNKLNENLKKNLEQVYSPSFIYDQERILIESYSTYETNLFYKSGITSTLHPELKILLSTSGTTGSPKFVKLSENNLIENAVSILDYLPVKPTDSTPLNLPVYYSYGLSVLTSNAIAGGKIICSNKDILQKEFWQDMEKFGYTSLSGVPYFYEILNRMGFTKQQYPTLRYLTQAGGKLNEKMLDIFSEYSTQNAIDFYVMYGQTEATARMSYLAPTLLNSKKGSIGKPIKNGQFNIISETGELVYEGPNVFGGYAEKVEDLATFETTKKLHTGDIAEIDSDGYYYIKGRLKRIAKIFGNRVNLDEIEQLLKNNFQQNQFACAGLNDQFLVIGITGSNKNENEIRQFISDTLKIHPTVIKTAFFSELPLTANGKPDYAKLAELFS